MEHQATQEALLSQAMDLIVESGADLKTLFEQDGLFVDYNQELTHLA